MSGIFNNNTSDFMYPIGQPKHLFGADSPQLWLIKF